MCDNIQPELPESYVRCCGKEHPVDLKEELDARTEEIEARLNKQPQQQLTEAQFRKLRGKFFTVRHHRVKECNHLLDMINEPTFRNCEYCWWSFFSSHGELVQVTDKAMQEQGSGFIDKMRGREYRKRFCQYMSTLARFKKEVDEQKVAENMCSETNMSLRDNTQNEL